MDQLRYNAREMATMKGYVKSMDSYLSKANASDETIIMLTEQNKEYKQIISDYDTAITQLIPEPTASADEVEQLQNYLTTLSIKQWQRQKPLSKC
jgi:hypothetical protein